MVRAYGRDVRVLRGSAGGRMKPNKKMRRSIAEWHRQGDPPDDKCVACNGSGRYDTRGSPKCGACGGTGKRDPLQPKS